MGGFIVAFLVGSAGITVLALWPPVFGRVSTLGGALGLVYFLGFLLPGGVLVRDAVRPASVAFVRGRWTRPDVKAAERDMVVTGR